MARAYDDDGLPKWNVAETGWDAEVRRYWELPDRPYASARKSPVTSALQIQ